MLYEVITLDAEILRLFFANQLTETATQNNTRVMTRTAL